ncbi:MAG: EVE domain-containing protein [Candidatus Competibacteraceae bacterium]|nr:EVE domain-containing protein [Candidatus Competibacteraceae bacterium]
MNYWLVKSEPSVYSWTQLEEDGNVVWDGVRNFSARNHLRAMKKGDRVLFYHSNEGMAVMGVAIVSSEAYQDPTDDSSTWSSVDLIPETRFNTPVLLKMIKTDSLLSQMQFVKQSRLSVSAVTSKEFDLICELGNSSS